MTKLDKGLFIKTFGQRMYGKESIFDKWLDDILLHKNNPKNLNFFNDNDISLFDRSIRKLSTIYYNDENYVIDKLYNNLISSDKIYFLSVHDGYNTYKEIRMVKTNPRYNGYGDNESRIYGASNLYDDFFDIKKIREFKLKELF